MTGIRTFKPDGTPVITPTVVGGVFLGMHQQRIGDPPLKTFLGAVGLTLLVYQVGAGSFVWDTGNDANGNPTITFYERPAVLDERDALLLVFAI